MVTEHSRRRVLQACAVGFGVGVAGCTAGNGQPEDDAPTETAASPTDPTTATETQRYTLYIENFDEKPHTVELKVREQSNQAKGEIIQRGRYSVSGQHGLTFVDIAEVGKTYRITATLDATVTESYTWDAETCSSNDEAPDGNRDASVRISDDTIGFEENACDAISVGYELAYGPANQYTATPTPGNT